MKTISYLAFLASIAIATTSYAATTDVMGGMVSTIPDGETYFAPAFIHNDTFVGDVATVSEDNVNGTTVLTFTGVNFDLSGYAEGSIYPAYYVEILEEGSSQGYVFDVSDNDATSLTVHGLLDTDFGVTAGMQIALRKHLTIGELFESIEDDLIYAELVTFYNSDGSQDQLFWIAPGWSPDFFTDHSDRQIYPGTGFKTTFASEKELVISGKVRNSTTKVPTYGAALNVVGTGSPVEIPIGNLDLPGALQLYESVSFFTTVGGELTFGAQYFADPYSDNMLESDLSTVNNTVPIDPNRGIIINATDTYITLPAAY